MKAIEGKEWFEYYRRFPYFSTETVRDYCHPWVFQHASPSEKAIVLIHGLTDSPYFLKAVAKHFHTQLGYDVYLPLLHCHGLKAPMGMAGVDLGEWKANAGFAVQEAAKTSNEVSVGGLSTGGALAFYMASIKPQVNGSVYLFSAALDLAGGSFGLIGNFKEWLLRTSIVDIFDSDKSLIGPNPYRYDHMDIDGAKELARLIKETDDLQKGYGKKKPFPKRIFAAHSECDKTAHIQGIRKLKDKTAENRFTFYIIPKKDNVAHAELVLEKPVFASIDPAENEKPLEKANPKFADMMAAVSEFERGV